MENITRDYFNSIYYKHLPNKFIIFIYKYFSKENEKRRLILSNAINDILMLLFFIGFIGTILNISKPIIHIVIITYLMIIVSIVLIILIAIILNNKRINKITKELNITRNEYDNFIKMYYK